jgi:hypothetical protein
MPPSIDAMPRRWSERYVSGPSGVTGSARAQDAGVRRRRHEKPRVHDDATQRDQPERQRIDARKRHVACADHQRHEIICKPEHQRHRDEEDHRRSVHREHPVERLWRNEIVVRPNKLEAHDGGFGTADQEED